jgi:glycosyltransferase involved in cell wall biosynthesis
MVGVKMKAKKLSIVMPVYNEKDLIIPVLKKVKEIKIKGVDIELIIVDDCSTDGTREILKKEGLKYGDKVLYHEVNQGKGAASRTCFKEITGDVAIVQDADFEYDPMEIPSVVKPIFDGKADVVYRSRFLNKEYKGYKKNQLANRILTWLSNVMTGLKVTDMETCYKAFKAKFIKNVDIKEKRFGFEPEITAKVSRAKLKLVEVPISYYPRTKEEGKKIKFKDGFRALYCIAKYKHKD